MNAAFRDALATHAKTLATHVGVVDETGTPIGDRQAASFDGPTDGVITLTADKNFTIPAGVTVGGWQAYDASTAGTAWGVNDVPDDSYPNGGTFILKAGTTGVAVNASA